jgi:Asp-tRNA(Asn)/Glu-tRNA(Gln) amidotransferase A subunit family amidase
VIRLADWLRAPREERERARHACLDRIRTLDPSIHAWVQVSPQPATGDGPLDGIPFGAKDIIETHGLATEYGSPVYQGRIGSEDAAIVRDLRQRGAILMGKTQTTAFAYRTPAPTRNPRKMEHTPGGSSSGSAAAVAAGMVPLALGSQTLGSVLRPAAFCGVTGFKPTYGVVPLDGVLPLAPSLDTLGFFTHTAADMLALWEALDYHSQRATPNGQLPTPNGQLPTPNGQLPTPNGQLPTPNGQLPTLNSQLPTLNSQLPTSRDQVAGGNWEVGIGGWELTFGIPDPLPDVEPSMAAALRETVSRLRQAGATIQGLDLVPMLIELHTASRVVMAYEAAIVHRERYEEHGATLADIADLVREGRGVSKDRYDEARGTIAAWRDRMTETYDTSPVILVPAAVGPAPFSLASTGDPRMNSPWTALGTPAIAIPIGEDNGLPLGLQLTASPGDDVRLLHSAVQVETILLQRT